MGPIDPRLTSALAAQLERRRALLRHGHEHVGWKLGTGDRERMGDHLAVGHLTSATQIAPGDHYFRTARDGDLHADAELGVQLGSDVDPRADASAAAAAIAAYGAALEIVDLAALPDEPRSVVVANVFHRAVAFGKLEKKLDPDLQAKLVVNGEVRASARAPDDLPERIRAAARLLDAVGERLRAGDRIATGSIAQVPVRAGDEVVAEMGAIGAVAVTISAAGSSS